MTIYTFTRYRDTTDFHILPPDGSGATVPLVGLVFLLLNFRSLVTAFQEVRRLIKRGFEQAEQLLVRLHQSAVRSAALLMGEQPFMLANIRKE